MRFEFIFMTPDGAMLAELGDLISNGSVKPIIDSEFPLNEITAAYDQLDTGRTVGKIVVAVK